MEILTGIGLSSSAGLNAYVPLLVAGLLSRYTDLLSLGPSWQWLESPWTLGILAVLLIVELCADKIPALDHINDIIQTVVRPTSGGIVFGASGSAVLGEPEVAGDAAAASVGGDVSVWLAVVGAAIALFFHLMKAAIRLLVNMLSVGVGAPVLSTMEDAASVAMAILAVLLPVLVVIAVVATAGLGIWLLVRLRRRRKQKKAEKAAQQDHQQWPEAQQPHA
ncbi:conserved hypothetical protein [Thermobifida fusca YX]|uniref:DUF4126 domain-containing protein n=1 Tax=Thermobifida fusca (strain YX) TaxID=269800 RepID=Q47RC4_THEFY|nr:conserved hypothetical protein [Thermobifida fusca YX]